jgi:glycerol-3-phosphate cytidylyltransferase
MDYRELSNLGKCAKCGEIFKKNGWQQIYCGSKSKKNGCSWQNINEKKKIYSKSLKMKQYHREYGKKWKKQNREKNTEYAKRQREEQKLWFIKNKEYIKIYKKEYRKKNIQKILLRNKIRQRKLTDFPNKEWLEKLYAFTHCPKCGINREELKQKYHKNFTDFTVDHFIPLHLGGTNDIHNLRPLCVGCNARKHKKMPVIGYVGATMDILHPGHIDLLKKAKEKCDYLIVVLNKDEFVEKYKGKRPIMSLEQRIESVNSLWMVDEVDVNEYNEDSKPMLLKHKPDLIFVGDDYSFEKYCKQMSFTYEWLQQNNMEIVFIPRIRKLSSTDIKRKILNEG